MSDQPTIGSLFTGAARLDHAVESRFGARMIWYAEHEPATEKNPKPTQAAARLLAHRYPDLPNLGDVGLVDWTSVPRPNIIGGGFPCQDLSLAGGRAGLRHSQNRSGQWAHMLAAVDTLRPDAVVIENVRGLLSAKTDGSDLELCPWCLGNVDPDTVVRALGVVLGNLADLGVRRGVDESGSCRRGRKPWPLPGVRPRLARGPTAVDRRALPRRLTCSARRAYRPATAWAATTGPAAARADA